MTSTDTTRIIERREAVRVISEYELAARDVSNWYVAAMMGLALRDIADGVTVDYVAARIKADRVAAEHLTDGAEVSA